MCRPLLASFGLCAAVCFGVFTLLATANSALGATASELLLPNTTKFSLSIPNAPDFNERFDQTQIGQLLADASLAPFLEDLPRQLKSQEASDHPLAQLSIDLGVGWNDLRVVPSGEITWSLHHDEGETPTRAFLAQVGGRQEQVSALLKKIAVSMAEQNAEMSQGTVNGTPVTVYKIPAIGKVPQRTVVLFVKNDQLVATETATAAKFFLNALENPPADNLAQHAAYQQVLQNCQADADGQAPQVVFYLVPVELGEALRALGVKRQTRGTDPWKVARNQNFDAITAVGGFVHVGDDPYDFYGRISVHAPKPWKQSMRICEFPNGTPAPAAWISDDLPSLSLLNVDFASVAKYVGPLFDDVYGEGEEGVYEDVKYSLLEDPDGPQLDVDKELFGRFSQQVSFVTRYQLPVTPDSPQKIIAIPTEDEQGLGQAVKKALATSSEVEVKEVAGHVAYFGYEVDAETREKPSFIACVAKEHLFLATDAAVLEQALTVADGQEPLSIHADFEKLSTQWQQIDENASFRQFARLQNSLHVNYELFRQGTTPSPSKTFRGLMRNIVAGAPPPVEEPKLDGSKLPAFDEVRKYFGLAGITGKTMDTGWFLHGFILKHDAP